MLSRALSLATLLLLAGWFAPERAAAQENLDAGKSPSQLFAGTCNACHRSPRGLLRSVPPGSLSSFLREHYTTSPAMAGVLATYLISNGATDTRLGGGSPREGAKEGARSSTSRPTAKPDEGQPPVQAAIDRGPDGRKLSAKQRLSKHGRPGAEEPPKTEETPSGEMPKEATGESKPEGTAPAGEGASQSAKVEEPGEAPATRVDPVPPVTPAPSAAPATAPTTAAPVSSVASSGSSEGPAVPLPSKPTPPPSAVTAAAPALPPVPPAGPPVPPISQ
jgi:hypothetical protein